MDNKQIDFNLIRECMIEHAEYLGRPYFDLCVVKRVVNSFITGCSDPLKPVIQKMVADKHSRNSFSRRRELLNMFCEGRSYMKLAALSEISAPTMKRILIGQLNCTDEQWARILNAFELM